MSANWFDKKHHFEVIVGKRTRCVEADEEDTSPSHKRLGFVQTLETKPRRRLYEMLQSQGIQMHQVMTLLSDGDEKLRDLQLEMRPKATHIFDWFHLSMKLTVLGNYGKGWVQCETVLSEAIQDQIERLQWSLWHGQADKALGKMNDLETSIEPLRETSTRFTSLMKALSELRTSIVNNQRLIPNDGKRYRNGEAIATGLVESTVNEVVSRRCCKKAHGMAQRRVVFVVTDACAEAERGAEHHC